MFHIVQRQATSNRDQAQNVEKIVMKNLATKYKSSDFYSVYMNLSKCDIKEVLTNCFRYSK